MRSRDAIRDDLLVLDRLPVCGDCGDYAHPSSTRCESCGARLYPTINSPARQPIEGDTAPGQEVHLT